MKNPRTSVSMTAFTNTVEFKVAVIQFTDQNRINLSDRS
jgi:hypothetical protein